MSITEIRTGDYKKAYYPLEEAVVKAAMQNHETDIKRGVEANVSWDNLEEEYKNILLEEAQHLLQTSGENYIPEFAEHEHICLKAD